MWTELHWVEGPWPGKLALAARPRGGEWLEDEITRWQGNGVHTIFSLLTDDEERELYLTRESAEAHLHGMKFFSYPIVDRQVPQSQRDFGNALEFLEGELTAGRNVVLHCRQGVGRTGLVAACLLVTRGTASDAAVSQLSAVRGTSVPDTSEQIEWINCYTASFPVAELGRIQRSAHTRRFPYDARSNRKLSLLSLMQSRQAGNQIPIPLIPRRSPASMRPGRAPRL